MKLLSIIPLVLLAAAILLWLGRLAYRFIVNAPWSAAQQATLRDELPHREYAADDATDLHDAPAGEPPVVTSAAGLWQKQSNSSNQQ